jgi:signal transduction histidine kinase
MIYMFLFAIVIKHDDRTRLRNLDLYQELETYAGNTASIAKQDERNRISRELHDTLGHYLVGMNIQLQKAAAYREIDPEESYLAVEKAREASSDAMRELRQTLSNLREMEETYDFKQEIEKMLSAVKENNLEVNFVYNGSPDGYSELVLTTLQRAVQEGLTNVQKHSQATQVDLRIDFNRREASLLLEDNGIGFSNRDREKDGHYGLNGLEERIDLVGGKIRIQSRKDKGTKIKINIPKRLFS